MTMRKGIVVEVHPEDHSVDLVMADDGSRLVGVQVMTPNGSTRTGSVNLPEIPKRANKWDIGEPTGQDMHAIVAYVGRHPVVTGFLYPQINQMLHKDPKLKLDRHQSDVTSSIDGDGNIQINHPSGTYVRIGETPDAVNMANGNADSSLAIDRNTGRRVNIRIGMADGVLELTMSPTGAVTLTCQQDISFTTAQNINFEAAGSVNITAAGAVDITSGAGITETAPSILFDAPASHFSGIATSAIDFVAIGVSLIGHVHPGVKAGTEKTMPPG